jgi:hypothetical protein
VPSAAAIVKGSKRAKQFFRVFVFRVVVIRSAITMTIDFHPGT